MTARLIAIVKSKAFIIVALLVVGYALTGFVLVPYLVSRYLPAYAAEQLHRQASIGKVRFNPFQLTFEANDLALKEADGRPIAGFKRLLIDFEIDSLFRRTWTFDHILLEQPSVLLEIGADRRMNLAALADSFPKSEEPPAPASPPPPVLFRHIVLSGGHFTFNDLSHSTPASATLEPLDLELRELSTLPERQGPYTLRAELGGGGKLAWNGQISLRPLNAAGRFELTGLDSARVWRFLRDRVNLAEPQGTVDLKANYRFALGDGPPRIALEDIGVTVGKLSLKPADAAEPILALDALRLDAGRFDFNARELSVGTVEIGPGQVRVDVDESGALNWQKLTRASPAPASAPEPAAAEPAQRWKVSLPSVRIDRVGLRYQDASRAKPVALDVGAIDLGFGATLETRAEGLGGAVRDGTLNLTNVAASEVAGRAPLLELERLAISGLGVDLGARDVRLGRILLAGGGARVTREKDGRIGLLDFISPQHRETLKREVAKVQAEAQAEGNPWLLGLDLLALDQFTLAVADQGIEPATMLDVIVKHLALSDIHTDGKTPMGFQAALAVKQGGSIDAEGRIGANAQKIDGALKVVELSLMPIEAYVARFTTLKLASGHVSTAGKWTYEQGESGPSVGYDGTFGIGNLMLKEAGSGERFLAWRSLDAGGFKFGLAPDRLNIAEVRVREPGAKIVVFEDRSVNLGKVLKQEKSVPPNDPGAPVKPGKTPAGKTSGAAFPVNIERVRIEKGEVDFADLSLVIPFATRIREFNGSVNGISSVPSSRAKVQLEGRVEDYGLARVYGSLQPLQPKQFTDITVVFRNVPMKPLTPYSATFAGRKIASGSLNLELQYKIDNSQLAGENKVVLEKFTLGDRVESPKAINQPLDLAIALLTDAQGKIDVAVPVQGDLNNPRFRYGEVIWQAIVNVIKNTVTAPFRALGKVFGGDTETLSAVVFEPGSDQLLPPEQGKLAKLAEGLKQRLQLKLQVQGKFDGKLDGGAMRSKRVRQALATALGVELAPGEDPGPVAYDNARTQRALETLLEARAGSKAVAEFETAREKSTGAKATRVNPALALVGRASPDSAFYQALFERLVELEPLAEAELVSLAQNRTKAIVSALSGFGIESARIAVLNPTPAEKAATEGVESALTLAPIETGG